MTLTRKHTLTLGAVLRLFLHAKRVTVMQRRVIIPFITLGLLLGAWAALAQGTLLWQRTLNGTAQGFNVGVDIAHSVAVDTEGNVLAARPAASRAEGASIKAERTDLQRRVGEAYGRLPLTFEPNRGRTDPRVAFVARGPGYTVFLTPTEVVFSLARHGTASTDTAVHPSGVVDPPGSSARRESAVLRMTLMGANPQPRITGRDARPGKAHYFTGNDPTTWRTHVPTFGRVHYSDVYPGIDLTFYGNQRQLEYDFIVGPGADPRRISLQFEGADAIAVEATGDLVLRTGGEDDPTAPAADLPGDRWAATADCRPLCAARPVPGRLRRCRL